MNSVRTRRESLRGLPLPLARLRRSIGERCGAAVAELAVCLPMLTLVVFGSIQACNLIYLKHGVTTAAYEGSLELSKRSASNASITARVQQVLDARGIVKGRIRILPAGTEASDAAAGTPISIEVRAKVGPNMSLSGFFPLPTNVTAKIAGSR